jgi:hypothetical protein
MVEGPVTGGGGDDCCIVNVSGFPVDLRSQGYEPGTPFYTFLNFEMAEVGYTELEYYISGTATSYIATDALQSDGRWSIQPADVADYKSRIVVLRPISADDIYSQAAQSVRNPAGIDPLDGLGNAKGGIRTPYVDAPVAILRGGAAA